MNRRLIILEDPLPPREIIPEGGEIEIGRAPEVTVQLSDRSVSRRHAVIRQKDQELILEDAGSTFGTCVNDRMIRAGEQVVLKDGDVLRFGKAQIVCRFDPKATDVAKATQDAAFAAQANARILMLEGELVRRRPLAGVVTLIGSASHCEVRLQERGGPPEQALIRASGGRFWIEPRFAANLPLLNETQAPVLKPVELPSNSVILVHRDQILFLYDFECDGRPVADPLAALSRKQLLRHVAEHSGHSYRALKRLCQDRRTLGQNLGEILVEKGIVTPIFWRVLCSRIQAATAKRRGLKAWFGRKRVRRCKDL
ncbi:MAG: FHA domain-containing protein [Planctomycetes bacterium]|nr:FHA domain-containing protein [Planctomycetota bacterium]